jgi:RES domain-containing protein
MLPVGWDAVPPWVTSMDFGDGWITGPATAVLIVPSVVVPEETCVLIDSTHPDAVGIRLVKVGHRAYDQRMT